MSRNGNRATRRKRMQPPASGQVPSGPLSQQDIDVSADALVAFQQWFADLWQRREQRDWSGFLRMPGLATIL